MKRLMMLVLLATCDGKCSGDEAVFNANPDAYCVANSNGALCLRDNEIFACSVSGGGCNKFASCTRIGTFVRTAEVPK